ncbi:MAG: transposase [Ktedonobacteraceae bacterium]|nr:transposase [Ktedonobacteraceae bacterium]
MAHLARDLGISDSALSKWCKEFGARGEEAFPGKGHQIPVEEEIRTLKRENEVLRQERDILKKALSIFAQPLIDQGNALLQQVSNLAASA